MMEPDTTQAIEIIRQGNLVEGARLLSLVIKDHPEDEMAWLWMSACVSDKEKKIYCLQKVIQINPSNQAARKGLVSMGVEVPPEVVQPVYPDEGAGFTYRDLTATLGGHSGESEQPTAVEAVQDGQVTEAGGTFEEAVRQAQASQPLPVEETDEAEPRSTASGDKAMMLEDFGFPSPEPEINEPPQILESVEPMPKPARRRRGKNNWLLVLF
jgi:hypothetical protein